jgi:cobyrinic acid a,c-diamide synthase
MSDKTFKHIPRVIIAGTSGDSGKTLVTIGLLAGFKQLGYKIAAFKKGPDFIDPAWLNAATGGPVRNLDTYLIERSKVYTTFVNYGLSSGMNIIEGNRGLYDGLDAAGTHSTAELARLIKAPVVLVCNVTKSTRTVAAIILGMKKLDESLNLAGVIINQVGGERHKKIVTDSIENITGIPVIGAIPRVKDEKFLPSRHLGLITPSEHSGTSEIVNRLGNLLMDNVDFDKVIEIAESADKLECTKITSLEITEVLDKVRIGYFSDSAFTFYYPENLECLETLGAELIPVSSLTSEILPDIDALYIGGGFPETHAQKLTENRSLMESVNKRAQAGLPVYAECGGLIYLCKSLTIGDCSYPMVDLFDADLILKKSPQGHGYSLMEIDLENPFFETGTCLKGHEFHYTTPLRYGEDLSTVMIVNKGSGFAEKRDGLVKGRVWASYLHLHASGEESWGANLIKLARVYRGEKEQSHGGSKSSRSQAL